VVGSDQRRGPRGRNETLGTALDELISEESLWPEAAAAIRLLLLTGARLNEILTARWEWVDADRRTIELPDSKTGKKTIFLSTAAVQVLNELKRQQRDPESPFLLPGRSKGKPLNNLAKSWRRVCERAEIRGGALARSSAYRCQRRGCQRW